MSEAANENRSVYRLRWIGYGLLIFSLFDTVAVLFPPGFTNPAWEFQTLGALVERVVVPILGMGLVFFGEFYDRLGFEKIPLKLLSWLCLVLAILFVLLMPLGVLSTLRLDNQNNQQVGRQVEQQLGQLKQLEGQLNQSKPEDIKALGNQLNSFGIAVDSQNPEDLKTKILARIGVVRNQLQGQADATRSNQRRALFKNSVKWNLGALISAVLFFILWKSTDWARRS